VGGMMVMQTIVGFVFLVFCISLFETTNNVPEEYEFLAVLIFGVLLLWLSYLVGLGLWEFFKAVNV
jgi:hypothetical protein